MKVKNFSERKNKRRLNALKHLKDEKTIENTKKNILPEARNIRTKKDRSKNNV